MKFTLPLSIILAALYALSNPAANFFSNLSNIFFIVGLIHLFIGLTIAVKNGGLFKGLNYFWYKNFIHKRKQSGDTDDPELVKPMNIYEFTLERYSKKYQYKHFLVVGISGFVFAIFLAVI